MRIVWAVVLLGIAPRVAHAHLTVAVLGTAGPAGDERRIVRISHGLAARDGSGNYRFVCPAGWGGPERALAGGGVVVGDDGVYAVDGEARLVRVGDYEGIPFAITSGPSAWLLTQTGTRSAVYRASPDEVVRIYQSSYRREGIAYHDGELVLAGVGPGGGLDIVSLSPDGQRLDERTVTATLAGDTLSLVSAGELYVRARDTATRIGRIEDDQIVWLVEAERALFGPVAVGNRRMIVEDGVLMALDVDGRSVVDDTNRYTCVEDRIVCTLRTMYRLGEEGVGELLFVIEDVGMPTYDGIAEPLSCEGQWIDFSREAIGPPPRDGGTAPRAPEEGCACTSVDERAAPRPGWALLGLLMLRRKRKR